MRVDMAPVRRTAPERTSPLSLLPAAAAMLMLTVGAQPARTQQPTPTQVQQALQQPGLADVLRQRIQASGLTAEQIRSRLAAGGYPSTLLDAYLTPTTAGQVAPSPGALEL